MSNRVTFIEYSTISNIRHEMSSIAMTLIHIMRKLKFYLDHKSLETIYLSFIRPLLEYRDVIWDNCTQYEKKKLDKFQNKAARIKTGTTKLVSLDTLYKQVGWQILHRRPQDHKITLFIRCLINSHLYICLP